ncbi:hypothetical protein K469DRAFT_739721 [Zopfia rhizophila CBS 207.26]|uniref:Uncharacterized protein n=1 Tax=Zopfia rhizophila CBS 207.26 TaxID=1314779 RepID=A0A6A6DVE1_9PEZI|nr:hypothetical protein K469DRAFT_739721 [Zopfia rhizophila CBS 207.26]
MADLSVGQVAGLIALGIVIAQFFSPNLLMLVLTGILRENETAATWSVAGRSLQSSYWPEILRTDSARSNGVRKEVLLSTYIAPTVAALCAIAGVVTPLGLYDAMEPSDSATVHFEYVKDNSPFGLATPLRNNYSFSRICSQFDGPFSQAPAPCPYTDSTVILSWNASSYTVKIVQDIYSSGTRNRPSTISNFFDIHWRQYTLSQEQQKNNGSAFLVGDYRPIKSLVLDNTTTAVEGLIVDTRIGGVGFRNHTLPVGLKRGATWKEDLLFVEPQTACVDTNLTMEFTINMYSWSSESSRFLNLTLVDNAAFLNNAMSMAYLNVTNFNNATTGKKAFSYINSFKGKRFPLPLDSLTKYDGLVIKNDFGDYFFTPSEREKHPNPFNITSDDFAQISTSCAGANRYDIANSSNIYLACGLMRAVPRRIDPGPPFLFEGGSKWSTRIFSCASALRATIKSVSFLLNGTSGLESLYITELREKQYTDNSSMPLWGIEESGLKYNGISPVWGLVHPAYEGYPNITLMRKSGLHLPGTSDDFGEGMNGVAGGALQYLPGSDFAPAAMNAVFGMARDYSVTKANIDYSGAGDMAMYLRWRNLSETSTDAATIINLIWTDLAANAVTGGKGVLGSNNAGRPDEIVPMTVIRIAHKVKYHMAYGVPAFILLLALTFICILALVSLLHGQANWSKLRTQLHLSSTGRIFTTVIYPESSDLAMSTKDWSRQHGKAKIDLSDGGVTSANGREGSVEDEHREFPEDVTHWPFQAEPPVACANGREGNTDEHRESPEVGTQQTSPSSSSTATSGGSRGSR